MKIDHYFGGTKSVVAPIATVLIGLALFGPLSNRNNFIIDTVGFVLFITYALLRVRYNYQHADNHNSKLKEACDAVLMTLPIIATTALIGINFFNASSNQSRIMGAIGFGMALATAYFCCYNIISGVSKHYMGNKLEKNDISNVNEGKGNHKSASLYIL